MRSVQANVLLVVDETHVPMDFTSPDEAIRLDVSSWCYQLHVNPEFEYRVPKEYLTQEVIQGALGELAVYAEARRPYFNPQFFVGVTHHKVGRIARNYGFDVIDDIPTNAWPEEFLKNIQQYNADPCLVVMSVPRLIREYRQYNPHSYLLDTALLHNFSDRKSRPSNSGLWS